MKCLFEILKSINTDFESKIGLGVRSNDSSVELGKVNSGALINRAMNTWDTAPPELKTFADQFIDGAPLQNYEAQDSSKK